MLPGNVRIFAPPDDKATTLIQLFTARLATSAFVLLVVGGCACGPGSSHQSKSPPSKAVAAVFTLEARRFENDGQIPGGFSCDGLHASPALNWSNPPQGTQSYALTIEAAQPAGERVLWIAYDLPTSSRELPEAVPARDVLLDGTRQGVNDSGRLGYKGPCPSSSRQQRYLFTLYALDVKLQLPAGADKQQLEEAMKNRVLGQTQLTGWYARRPRSVE
jgi:Raf kinase inhibitor-like YbhB/YbcL family protein